MSSEFVFINVCFQATKYNEEILKPREEARQEQEEREFYHFAGPAWKGKGHRLGEPVSVMECFICLLCTACPRKSGLGKLVTNVVLFNETLQTKFTHLLAKSRSSICNARRG